MDSIQNSSTIPTIRIAEKKDASALLDIYAPYVTDTAITFEYEIPSVEEFANRIEHTLKRYPYFIAEENGTPVGYAYASPFHDRPAYDWAVETSIYVDRSHRKNGIGRLLYNALERTLSTQNMVWMEKHIGTHQTDQPAMIPFSELKSRILL